MSYENTGEVYSERVKNVDVNTLINSVITPNIEKHFGVKIVDSFTELECRGTNTVPEYQCESTIYHNNMWYRNKDIDFATIIFLKDHLESPNEPIDESFEVYGGKLEFPTFDFSITPERGTAITYPSVPNFINAISKVKIGQQDVLRICHRSATMFVYEATEYPGNLGTWFKDVN